MNKRCGLPLALPLHAKKLCPDLSFSRRFGHRVLLWKTGKKPSRFCRSTSAAGVGYALRYREIPADRKIRRVFRACNDEALPGHWEGLLFRTG